MYVSMAVALGLTGLLYMAGVILYLPCSRGKRLLVDIRRWVALCCAEASGSTWIQRCAGGKYENDTFAHCVAKHWCSNHFGDAMQYLIWLP